MDKQHNSKLSLDDYKIESISYKYNASFQSGESIKVEIKTKITVGINKEKQKSRVTIDLTVFPDAFDNNKPFYLNIILVGFFSANETLPPEELRRLSQFNGTAILFPFVRSAIVNITAQANVEPLLLPLVDINRLATDEEVITYEQGS